MLSVAPAAGGMLADMKVRESSLSAVVTRADGTVEDLGVIAYYHRNPLRRLLWSARRWLKKG